jgi:hypothetical protein
MDYSEKIIKYWKLAPWLHSKHEKRTAGRVGETWTAAAADGACCAIQVEE